MALIVLTAWGQASFAQTDDDGGLSETSSVAGKKTKKNEEPWSLKPPQISLYVQLHYRYAFNTSPDVIVDNHNFRVQRVRIGLKGDVLPWVGYDLEIDPRAPEVAGILRDAFIVFKLIPDHKLRLGQQKTQFGYESRISSSALYFVNRAEVSDALSRGLNLRDIGLGLIGKLKLGGGFQIEDAITWVNGSGLNVQNDDTPMKNLWGRSESRTRSTTSTLASASPVRSAISSSPATISRIQPTTTSSTSSGSRSISRSIIPGRSSRASSSTASTIFPTACCRR